MILYQVVWSNKALSDLSECIQFVLNVSKEAATKLADDIYDSIGSLVNFPDRNPIFEMPKPFPFIIRKQVINHRYAALYCVEGKNVTIYRVLDSRRKFNFLVL